MQVRLIGTSNGSFSKLLGPRQTQVINQNKSVDLKQQVNIKESTNLTSPDACRCSPQQKKHITVPAKLYVIYQNDYNILTAHEIILQKLENEKIVLVSTLQATLNMERDKASRPQTVIERRGTLAKIEKIEHEIKEISSNTRINKYKNEIADIINKYTAIGQLNIKVTFGQEDLTKHTETAQSAEKMMYRHELIASFAFIAAKYYDIKIVRDIKQQDLFKCQCGDSITITVVDETGSYTCDKCNCQTFLPCYVTNVDALNSSSVKNCDYDNWENLHKELLRIQGRQHDKIPEVLLSKLDKYFDSKDIPSRNTSSGYPIENKSWYQGRKGTDVELMVKALQDIKEPDYYEDVHLLATKIWGWILPDLSGYESRIHEDYKATQKVYIAMNKERKSSLGTRYRLFKHLQLVGIDCNIKDFKASIMGDVIREHDDIWEKMCLGAGKSNIYFIETLK